MDNTQIAAELSEFLKKDLTGETYADILRFHRKYKKIKQQLAEGKNITRLAVLGSKSIQFFTAVLEMTALSKGIYLDIYEGEYDGITSEIIDESSGIYSFKPEFVCILTHYSDIKNRPAILSSPEELNAWAEMQKDFYNGLFERLSAMGSTILCSLFVSPIERQFDQLEESLPCSLRSAVLALNRKLTENRPKYVHYIDLPYLAEYAGKAAWFDEKNYYLSKAGFSYEQLPLVCSHYVSRLASLMGKTRKCLVLDLDNTLWGGTVGDLGPEGINLNPNDAVGESFLAFQEYILSLKARGVILAVCSKNEDDTARSAFEKNPYIKIKLGDIACFKANWDDKATNIRAIAAELNIGTDALVFVDDNPAERQIVRSFLPEVLTIELPEDPALYVRTLCMAMPFDWAEITKEDISRVDTYIENQKRNALLASFVDYDEYLRSLEMKGGVHEINESETERFVQLTNKSNQFNLRTQRLTEADVKGFMQDPYAFPIAATLSDSFSDYGIISCVVLKKQGEELFIFNWLMSCRVLKRGVEDMVMNAIAAKAKELGCSRITAEYIPSPKNKMVADFYDKQGFTNLGDGRYEMLISSFTNRTVFIAQDITG